MFLPFKGSFLLIKKLTALIFLLSTLVSIPVNASDKSIYYTNLNKNSIKSIFDVQLSEVVSEPLEWIKERESYITIQRKPDGSYIYWFNTPSLQKILYNSAWDILPNGYEGEGIEPYKEAEKKNYAHLMQETNFTTAQKKYGFNLPSPAYVGEYPRVTMNIMGVVVESNPIKFFLKKLGAFLGITSYISPPDNNALRSLSYVTPNDYTNNDNSFEAWIEKYWDETIAQMPDGQILMDKELVDVKGNDDAGVKWIKANIMDATSAGGEKIPTKVGTIRGKNTAKDISKKLEINCGPNYPIVVKNIILVALRQGTAEEIDYSPTRIMPYERESMRNFDKKSLKIDDPRVAGYYIGLDNILNIDGLGLEFGAMSLISNKLASKLLDFSGSLSRWTIQMNKLTNFSLIDVRDTTNPEEPKIDVMLLWKSPISAVIIVISLLMLVIFLFKNAIKIAMGKESKLSTLVKSFLILLAIGFIVFISVSPESFFDLVKYSGNLLFNMGSSIGIETSACRDFVKPYAPKEDKIDCYYWIPYFSLWSEYNTSCLLTDESNKINLSNIDNEPEQQENAAYGAPNDQANCIRTGEFNDYWSCLLADSVTKGEKIDNNIYRVVDHFMAPRIDYLRENEDGDEIEPLISARANENYKGKIQTGVDLGMFSYQIVILAFVFIKLLLFLEFVYELMMLQVNLAMSSITPNHIKKTLLKFGVSILRVGLWDIAISLVIFMSMYTQGVLAFCFSILIIYITFKGGKKLIDMNNIWTPRILRASTKFVGEHR